MIRSVKVPIDVGRMGCAPGASCCSACASEPPASTMAGTRNSALRGTLGDTACDSDGNCYDTSTGQLLSAPLTTGQGCAPGVASCGVSNTTLYLIGAAVLVGLLEFTGGKR